MTIDSTNIRKHYHSFDSRSILKLAYDSSKTSLPHQHIEATKLKDLHNLIVLERPRWKLLLKHDVELLIRPTNGLRNTAVRPDE